MDEFNDINQSEIKQITNGLVEDIAVSANQLKEADDRYKSLLEQAEKAKEQKIGIFSGKKVAIETLQGIVLDQSKMINDLWLWHTESLKHLKKLTEKVQTLFFISATSAAFTRAIIQELKNKTNGPITEAARIQLVNVIRDLERQADVHDRLNRIKEDVVNLKRDNLSYKDSVALLMGSLEDKYDREMAERRFNLISNDIQSISLSLTSLEFKQQVVDDKIDSMSDGFQILKNNFYAFKNSVSIWKLISISTSIISIISLLIGLLLLF